MLKLTDKQIVEYFKRSYTAVDGLWFMKVEEIYGFDTALDIDEEVWKVMPKIQARPWEAQQTVWMDFDSVSPQNSP